jgi:cytidylate kinase
MIITISRECGCGGHEIGLRLAKKLGIAFYDKKILAKCAKDKGINAKLPELGDDVKKFYNLRRSREEREMLKNLILEIASKEPCVIVGRCSDHILRDMPDTTRIFIKSSQECKIARVMERRGIGEKEAKQRMKKTDEMRRAYFEKYTGQPWGLASSYDFSLDSSYLGLNGCVEVIMSIIENRLKVAKCFD